MVGSISGNYSIDFKVCLTKTSNVNVIQDLKKVSDIIDNLIYAGTSRMLHQYTFHNLHDIIVYRYIFHRLR